MVSLPSWLQGKPREKGPRSMWKFHYMQEIWQDREIRFDVPRQQLQTNKGEFEIDSINSVEDTKGNNGKRGFLVVTNLRVIWAQHKNPTTNLSIGFNCITSINIKTVRSKLRGNVQGLYVMTKVPKPKTNGSKPNLAKPIKRSKSPNGACGTRFRPSLTVLHFSILTTE